MNKPVTIAVEDLAEPLTYGVEAFLSPDYAKAEKDKLWPHVWQLAERVEDFKEVGDFVTYNVADESIIILKTGEDEGGRGSYNAFHNVCPHRGRQLINVPEGTHSVRGNRRNFVCGFHGWTFDTEGNNVYILDQEDWKGALTPEMTCLSRVRVDTWGGWVWISMEAEGETLTQFLERAGEVLGHFELDKMRYKWRQWAVYPCNWKTAIEAFMEPYHVAGTHTQLLDYGDYYAYSVAYDKHSVSGFDQKGLANKMSQGGSVSRAGKGGDPRVSTYALARENYETLNYTGSSDTLVAAAKRLVEELPEGTPAGEVIAHWMKSAKADDAARGVVWPEIPAEIMAEAGLAWSLFPNVTILQGVTFALCYRTRPYGDDPDKCIFEAYALERFPEGEAPQTEWRECDATAAHWGEILAQDFANMEWVQKGMKSRGFRGTLPNPHQERKITNFHRNLAKFMGTGEPRLLK